LVTGRCVPEIYQRFDSNFFDAVVAENGALLVTPDGRHSEAPRWWPEVRESLLMDFRPGCEEIIISSARENLPLAERVLDNPRAKVVLNKDRFMIVPAGVDKGTGLAAALGLLGLKGEEVACVGDGENDISMFKVAGMRYALKNSVEELKSMAEFVASLEDGEGTIEVVDRILGTLSSARASTRSEEKA
jgi:phosphoglycolate phosphatase